MGIETGTWEAYADWILKGKIANSLVYYEINLKFYN